MNMERLSKILLNEYEKSEPFEHNGVVAIRAMAAAIRQALPIIKQHYAEIIRHDYGEAGMTGTGNKMYQKITSSDSDKELLTKLGIDK